MTKIKLLTKNGRYNTISLSAVDDKFFHKQTAPRRQNALSAERAKSAKTEKGAVMRHGDIYPGLSTILRKEGDFALLKMVEETPSEKRVEILMATLLSAANSHQDETALRYFQYLMQASKDTRIEPFLKLYEEGGVNVATLNLPDRQTSDNFFKVATTIDLTDQANLAMSAYQKFPSHQKGQTWPDENRKLSTLRQTKKAALAKIADCWRNTSNKEVANNFFNFLLGLPLLEFSEERDDFIEVIRQATDRGFPVKRLIRHFLVTMEKIQEKKNWVTGRASQAMLTKLATVIATAIARDEQNLDSLKAIFSAIYPLLPVLPTSHFGQRSSWGAFACVRDFAQDVFNFEEGIKRLKEELDSQKKACKNISFYAISEPEISYSTIRELSVVFYLNSAEKDLTEQFVEIKKWIKGWKNQQGTATLVRLQFVVKAKWSSDKDKVTLEATI